MSALRIAVWGIGPHARNNILPAIASVDGLELYGVCSRDPAVVAGCTSDWRCRGWSEPGSMLQDAAVDAVYVATPIGLHAAHGRLVLDAGKHLWCEKPLTSSLADTLELVEAARNRRLSLCEALMYLYHPQFERLLRYLSDASLGAIRSVTCRFGIPPLERPGFRNDPALGGGALFDIGCYPVSAVHALFPGDEIEVVHARMSRQPGSAVDSGGHAVLALSGGAEAWLEWRSGSSYRNEIDLWGERGSVSTHRIFSKPADYVPVFSVRDRRGAETAETGASANHFSAMLRYFRDVTGDHAAAEREFTRVARCAATLHLIRERAGPC